MAIRRIFNLTQDEETLRKKSRAVEVFDNRLAELLDDLTDTMREAGGVGLAAPQVGILKRVVVIEVEDKLYELVNPEIIKTSGSLEMDEGCLSIPGVSGKVQRFSKVTVKAQDRNGKYIKVTGTDLLARALCHETDHLDGRLFIDIAESISSAIDN